MSEKGEPVIEPYMDEDYTCITFYPDLKRFRIPNGIDEDAVSLLSKRAYDLAGVTDSRVRVFLNGKKINIANFS